MSNIEGSHKLIVVIPALIIPFLAANELSTLKFDGREGLSIRLFAYRSRCF